MPLLTVSQNMVHTLCHILIAQATVLICLLHAILRYEHGLYISPLSSFLSDALHWLCRYLELSQSLYGLIYILLSRKYGFKSVTARFSRRNIPIHPFHRNVVSLHHSSYIIYICVLPRKISEYLSLKLPLVIQLILCVRNVISRVPSLLQIYVVIRIPKPSQSAVLKPINLIGIALKFCRYI